MKLMDRLLSAFRPRSHDSTMSHYIPVRNYADEPVENSVWISDLEKPLTDWRGNTGRLYSNQLVTLEGPLMFAVKGVTTQGLGGTSIPYGQSITLPVSGFAGRPAAINPTSLAAEYVQVNG